ncbi:MAG: DUF4249 domain-containing protein [Bacteroidia bacterium]|nr:DUF4249 domain-containing protein [Bacteroidia bacterium]
MKTILKTFILAAFVVTFSSCEDVVQVKLDEGSKIYVIDAFVNDLAAPQTIRVLTSDSYFSNREAPPVPNASVVLRDMTDNKQYTFTYTSNGNYVYTPAATETMAVVNHQYQLEVGVDGVVYTSITTQKRAAKIDSIISLPADNGGFGPPAKDGIFSCYLIAKDKTDSNTDYYWVKTFRNDTLFNAPSDINLSIDGTNGPVSGVPVDSTDFTPPIVFLGFKPYKLFDRCKVEIHSISRDTYFFFVQAAAQINNGGLFATTPENVKTNIVTPNNAKTKAIGWFNMASVASQTKVVK